MVDIIIGGIPPINPLSSPPRKTGEGNMFEAELLNVRDPRYRGAEAQRKGRLDPQRGRVLTLMVPDGTILPKDLAPGKYKVMLRFVKK
ncbi:MAG: hypothetical protein LBD10_12485 [Desulfobulbus sp.]|jgi:hypothetical protein|uniref:hypothetical protein n=1 Tax=Desulfobulbus sp. TaxID=895 RepID=UPI002842EAF1|nr:hypothetical protein [Desulfobulbus sp.]MDR2551006.1 hypothetical protein [Desulfobulbus sp.]